MASADFETMEISASGGAGTEGSSSLCTRPSFQPCAEVVGCLGRTGVEPPSPSHIPWQHSALLYRPSEIRKSPTATAKVGSDEASLVRFRVMGPCADAAPLKDQPIERRQAVSRMVDSPNPRFVISRLAMLQYDSISKRIFLRFDFLLTAKVWKICVELTLYRS